MNLLKYVLVGILFGMVLTKTEAVSWYRIYEMFHFQSFHMYGIIGTAIATGLIGIQYIKRKKVKDVDGIKPIIKGATEGTIFRFNITRNGKKNVIEVKIPKKLKTADL